MSIEILRKYQYIWPEHTTVRLKKDWPKVVVKSWDTFESSYDKSFFKYTFKFLWEEVSKQPVKEVVKEVEVVVEPVKVEAPIEDTRANVIAQYVAKFGKRPFNGWTNEEILSKINN